jgi:RNA polymerase sigma-70 factor (ECF subfamily)
MTERITNDTARTLRTLWFQYLDTVEPLRPKLHAYCLKLTGSVFDAEDLVQNALLKGYAAIARAEYPSERILDMRAYFCRIATNDWIDQQRRAGRAPDATPERELAREPAVVTATAAAALFDRTAPQERAAIVLKDVFDFSLEDIADLLATTVGTVKSALHRGRAKLDEKHDRVPPAFTPASAELVDRFTEAFRSRDIEKVTLLLMESVSYEVFGVGYERGRKGHWINVNLANAAIEGVSAERHFFEGEWVSVGVHESKRRKRLIGVTRMAEAEGKVARVLNYYYCPDTLAYIADVLGMLPPKRAYHQDPETLARMIADVRVPWQDDTG